MIAVFFLLVAAAKTQDILISSTRDATNPEIIGNNPAPQPEPTLRTRRLQDPLVSTTPQPETTLQSTTLFPNSVPGLGTKTSQSTTPGGGSSLKKVLSKATAVDALTTNKGVKKPTTYEWMRAELDNMMRENVPSFADALEMVNAAVGIEQFNLGFQDGWARGSTDAKLSAGGARRRLQEGGLAEAQKESNEDEMTAALHALTHPEETNRRETAAMRSRAQIQSSAIAEAVKAMRDPDNGALAAIQSRKPNDMTQYMEGYKHGIIEGYKHGQTMRRNAPGDGESAPTPPKTAER